MPCGDAERRCLPLRTITDTCTPIAAIASAPPSRRLRCCWADAPDATAHNTRLRTQLPATMSATPRPSPAVADFPLRRTARQQLPKDRSVLLSSELRARVRLQKAARRAAEDAHRDALV